MPAAKSRNKRRTNDPYMELVRRFPLKTIKNDAEHERAAAQVARAGGGHG